MTKTIFTPWAEVLEKIRAADSYETKLWLKDIRSGKIKPRTSKKEKAVAEKKG